jgi:hypothetical protein
MAPARSPRTRIREVIAPDDPALPRAYALLKGIFSRNERIPQREWRDSLEERTHRVWTDIAWHLFVAERGDEVIGFASGNYLGNVNLGIIGYLAIAPGIRARGLGTRLRQRLIRCFEADALRIARKPLAGLIGEVKESNPWLSRLARRPGVVLLDFPYLQPRLHLFDRASPFVLYYEAIHRPRRRMPTTELRRVLYTLWRRVYRVSRPLGRPEFRAMLQSLDGRTSIGARRLPNLPTS